MKITEPSYELIWRGRTHLGSNPGVFGDACYAGLCTEWPVTLRKYDPKCSSGGDFRIRLEAEEVHVFPPYPGHRITVARYLPDDSDAGRSRWRKITLEPADEPRLATNELELLLSLPGEDPRAYLSVRVEVDTTMHPGVHDNFVVTRLLLCSTTYYASLGFELEEALSLPH